MRAFLPIKNVTERSRVLEYQGFGTVVDTRVVCMRPKLANVVYSTNTGFRLSGIAEVEWKPPGLMQQQDSDGSNNFSLTFNCGFAAAAGGNYADSRGWPLALCAPRYPQSQNGM